MASDPLDSDSMPCLWPVILWTVIAMLYLRSVIAMLTLPRKISLKIYNSTDFQIWTKNDGKDIITGEILQHKLAKKTASRCISYFVTDKNAALQYSNVDYATLKG